MIVPESYNLGQGSVHDRKLAPIVVVKNAVAAAAVRRTHPGQVKGYYVRYSGPRGGSNTPVGPFPTIPAAVAHAAKHAGFKRAPMDGWWEVTDAQGNPLVVT